MLTMHRFRRVKDSDAQQEKQQVGQPRFELNSTSF